MRIRPAADGATTALAGRALGVACAALLFVAVAYADATEVDAYAVGVEHTVVAAQPLRMAGLRLGQLERGLYDLRARLVSVGEEKWLTRCNPAFGRLHPLAPALRNDHGDIHVLGGAPVADIVAA